MMKLTFAMLSAKAALFLSLISDLTCWGFCFQQPGQWGNCPSSIQRPSLLMLSATVAQFPPTEANVSVDQMPQTRTRVKVRKTVDNDLGSVASFLSTATSSTRTKQSWPQGFQARIDRLFAKSDIESLLRGRLQALQLGERSWTRMMQQLQSSPLAEYDSRSLLRHWWSSSDTFRQSVHHAAAATAEPSVWRGHYHMTPEHPSWLQHVQLTAAATESSAASAPPVGFCEVTMLQRNDGTAFPAILNLAVAPDHRRQGIARRLVTVAERYVQRYWTTTSTDGNDKVAEIGLYVDESNTAARQLYATLGYAIASSGDSEATTAAGDSPFLFMTKSLRAKSSKVSNLVLPGR